MSRVTGISQGIAWDAVDGADDYQVFVDQQDSPSFLADIDAGNITPTLVTPELQVLFADIGGQALDGADFAVVAHAETDGVNVYSDPYSPAPWQDIPLDFAPLAAPTGGRLL